MNEDQLGFNFAIEIDKTISDKNILAYINEANEKFSFDFGVSVDLKQLSDVADKVKKLNDTTEINTPTLNTKNIVGVFDEADGKIQQISTNMNKMGAVTKTTINTLLKNGDVLKQVFGADDTLKSQTLIHDEVKKQNEALKQQKEIKDSIISQEKEIGNLAKTYAKTDGDAEKGLLYTQSLEKSLALEKQVYNLDQQGLLTEETKLQWLKSRQSIQEDILRIEAQQQDKAEALALKEAKQQENALKAAKTELEYQQKSLDLKLKKVTTGKNAGYEDPDQIAKVTKAMKELDGATKKEVADRARMISKEIDEIGTDANNRRISELGKGVNGLSSSFNNLTKVISATMIIRQLWEEMRKGVEYVKQLDEAYTDIAISMDLSRSKFNEWTKDARKIAQANGILTTDVMNMVKIYATAGEDISQVQEKLAGTAMLQNITQWDANETTSVVNSIVNQYKLLEKEIDGTTGNVANAIEYMGDALIGISNELTVDNVQGIREMASAIDAAGGVMEQSGASMEWYMAIAGTLNEKMNATGKCRPPYLETSIE